MKAIKNSYLIEINLGSTVPGAGANLTFADYPQLRDVYVTGIEVVDETTLLKSPSGKTLVANTLGLTVSLIDKFNQQILTQYPATDLDPKNRSGFYRDFVPFPLQLTKSYITVLSNTGLTADESVCLNIFYITKKEYDAIPNRGAARRQ